MAKLMQNAFQHANKSPRLFLLSISVSLSVPSLFSTQTHTFFCNEEKMKQFPEQAALKRYVVTPESLFRRRN